MATIAIAGATGFVGSGLIKILESKHRVVALTRGDSRKSDREGEIGVEWRTCDLFSMLEAEEALAGVDYAVYLIHSMLPSAELTQGEFEDLDLLVADNFAKAARLCGLKHIVYIGGIIPEKERLSRHLQSRKEVEECLRASKIPLTVLRAAMIIGARSSSLQIMTRLVKRLPIMICPSWTRNRSNPIFLNDVISAIDHVLGNRDCMNKIYDLGKAEDAISYVELMQTSAKVLGLKRLIFPFPYFMKIISSYWVSLVTGAPRNLVKPLIESLRHEMIVDPKMSLEIEGKNYTPIEHALSLAYQNQKALGKEPRAFVLPGEEKRIGLVRSVQRFKLPKGLSAKDVGAMYLEWLPKKFSPFLRVDVEGDLCSFCLPFISKSLLTIERSDIRSSDSRQLFYIRGGLLVGKKGRGRLEFRETYDRKEILAAIHDYDPALPWQIYKFTQALLHLWVMSSFEKHLKNASSL